MIYLTMENHQTIKEWRKTGKDLSHNQETIKMSLVFLSCQ